MPPPPGGGGLKDRIKPAATGKVIAVTSGKEDTDNHALVQEDYSEGSDRQLWNITKNSRGNYVIRPKSRLAYDKDYCMSAGDYAGFTAPNGLNVNQKLYVDDTDLRDEWGLSVLDDYPQILLGYHVPNITFSIQCTNSLAQSTEWNSLIIESANEWNNSVGTNITVTSTSNSVYTCQVISSSESWLGQTIFPQTPDGIIESAMIQINSSLCTGSNNAKKSTITHEIGHLLGLSDNPPIDDNASLMNHTRNRNTVYVPQPYDIYNVKYVYGLN